jgi:hypothetical protein
MTEQSDIARAHCNRCQGETNHHVLFELKEPWEEVVAEDEHGRHTIGGREDFEVLKCCGCDTITVRNRSWFSGETDYDGRPLARVRYYPPATSRKPPTWLQNHEGDIFMWHDHFVPKLLHQIYTALFADCLALAAMGIRALLERTMIEKCSDQGTFENNLKSLRDAGYIGEKQIEALRNTLELGHATIHRNFNPSVKEILLALDITEAVLAAVYVHSDQAAALKKRIPPRTK